MGLALGTLALSSFLAELFPTRLRYSGLSLTYGLASTLFGGTAPALATLLARRSGGALLPAWYATCITAVALVGVLLSPETAPRPLDTGERGERCARPVATRLPGSFTGLLARPTRRTNLTRCGWCRSAWPAARV